MCEKPMISIGLCNTHYVQLWRERNPKRAKELVARYYQKFKSSEKYPLWRERDAKRRRLKSAKLRLKRLKRDYPELF